MRGKATALGVILLAGVLVLSATGAPEDGGGRQVLKNLRYPIKDAEGRKTGELVGDEFRMGGGGPVEVKGLRWTMIRPDGNDLVVTSEACRYNADDGVISSEASIRIDRGDVVMTGDGYVCDLKQERLVILNNARVVIRGKELWERVDDDAE